MKISNSFFALAALLLLVSCQQPGGKKDHSSIVKLPAIEQGFVDQFHHALTLIPDSLEDERKTFLEDSLKNTIDLWLSDKIGMKADHWLGVVMNDTVGQSFGAGHAGVLQLYIPISKISDTTSARYDFTRSITLTMSVDEDDPYMIRARKQFFDGDTVVFSGYFNPMGRSSSDAFSRPGDFLASPSLDFTPTELYKKGAPKPPARSEPDTAGLAKAPVKVTAKMTVKRSDGYRYINIKITVKNISDKQITRAIVNWMETDKAGHPAKIAGVTGIWQQGYFNQTLDPGESMTEEWQHDSPDAEKVQLVFPKVVSFYNGIKWRAGTH